MYYLSIIGLLPLLVASVLALETNFDRNELVGTLPSNPRQQSDPTVKAQGFDSDHSHSEYDWNDRANIVSEELPWPFPSSTRQQRDPAVKAQKSDSDHSHSEYDWNDRANIVSEELPWPFPSSPRQQRDPAVKAQRSNPCKKDPKVMSMRRTAHKLDSSYEYYDDYDC